MSEPVCARHVESTYLRLGNDASIEPFEVNQRFWEQLQAGELGDFHNEYLVSTHTTGSDWTVWEMHPKGDEMVCLLAGKATFILEREDGNDSVQLTSPGSFAVIPRGTWHTVTIQENATILFITAGEGTQHRAV